MQNVLVDNSSWIDYFKGKDSKIIPFVNELLDAGAVCTNNIVLAELTPVLGAKKEYGLVDLMNSLTNVPLDIDWQELIKLQGNNIKNGINKVGIPDLIILQNVIQNDLRLFSLDRHFKLMRDIIDFDLIER